MKNNRNQNRFIKAFLAIFIFVIAITQGVSQTDTLHIYYAGAQTKTHDSTTAKIAAWAKKLNGRLVKLDVVAYYAESDFKKFSAERADELFLVLNRKARSLITIETIGPKKGKKWQRSMVDIIYTYTGGTVAVQSNEPVAKKSNTNSTNTATNTGGTNTVAASNNTKVTTTAEENGPKPFVAKEQFKARKLMVVLLDEIAEQVDRLKEKPEEQQAYRNNVKTHNENITKAFKTFWKSSPVDFIKESELEAMSDFEDKATNWILLLPGKAEIENVPFMTYNVNLIYKETSKSYISNAVFKISLNNEMPDEADFLLLMHKMKVYYGVDKEFNLDQLEETLAKKNLLVEASQTEMGNDYFKEAYMFPFTIKTTEEVKEKTKKGEKDVLYLKADVFEGKVNYMIVDAETGSILARTEVDKFEGGSGSNGFAVKNNVNTNYEKMAYNKCIECPFYAGDIIKSFNQKLKIKKSVMKDLANEKKQIKSSDPLTIY